jgi:hypothetical protein
MKVTAIVPDLEAASFNLDDQGLNPKYLLFVIMSKTCAASSTMATK